MCVLAILSIVSSVGSLVDGIKEEDEASESTWLLEGSSKKKGKKRSCRYLFTA